MVGAKFVEISFGSAEAPPVQDGDTIEGEPPVDFSDLLKKTSNILDSTQSTTGSLSSAADNLNSISAKINRGQGTLGAMVNDKQMYNQLNATTAQAEAGAAAFKDNMQALQHNFLLRGFFNKRGYNDSAELTAHAVDSLPQEPYIKRFSYSAQQLFDKPDTARLKSPKILNEAGNYLQSTKFGSAVVVAYTGGKGDSERDKTLTEARSMMVRDYLVKNFSIVNDTLLKTMGVGKDAAEGGTSDGGVEILIFPAGSGVPYAKNPDISSHP
jgi:outer membrane protein OmpA-like peptidoglycan-associated protein